MTESTQLALLPESAEERIARLDGQILSLLMGHRGGPLGLALSPDEKAVLTALRYMRGATNAMPIRELQRITRLGPREIKQTVRTLRMNFALPIGSSKSSGAGGYFIMVSPEDVSIWAKDVLDQVRAEVAVLRTAAGRQAALEMLGQLHMEMRQVDAAIDQEASHA